MMFTSLSATCLTSSLPYVILPEALLDLILFHVSLGSSDLQNLVYVYHHIPPSSQLTLDSSYEISPY